MPNFLLTCEQLAGQIWLTFNSAAAYILLGLFISGLMHAFIPPERITRYLGGGKFKSVFLAALFGVPIPLCSCGVIPAAISLRKSGASKAATLAFLISTPETGVDSIALSYALLDPLMTIFRPIAAFATAVIAGVMEIFFDREQDPNYTHALKDSCCSVSPKTLPLNWGQRLKASLRYAFVELLESIAGWLVLGIVTAGAISYFLPEQLVSNYLGSGWLPMVMMLLIGIPLYVCASGSTPIAAALILKGLSPGAALVFLLAGPATNPATIIMTAKFLGKRALVIYLSSIAICSLGFGWLLNWIYQAWHLDIKLALGQASSAVPHQVQPFFTFLLIILIVNALLQDLHEQAR